MHLRLRSLARPAPIANHLGMVFACERGVRPPGRLFVKNHAVRKSGGIMDQTQPIWIRDPLSILADGAERGVVVRGGKIVELVPRGREPATANPSIYDASAHVVLPGLINTHHHFYHTLTRALPAALDR